SGSRPDSSSTRTPAPRSRTHAPRRRSSARAARPSRHTSRRAEMERRDEAGVETTAIADLVSLDGKRVLDVGCGQGRLTAFAAERAAFVYAFDPSPDRVSRARVALKGEERRRVRFAVHDLEALDLPRERFDVALCGW